jgi:GAF domain-containing protein
MKPDEQKPIEVVRDMMEQGVPRTEILTYIASEAEGISGEGSTASILVLDEQGLLRNGASPNLPDDYLAAIDRLKPDANVGTCAAAAATGDIVVTQDFLADDKWAELRHLPSSLGYVGAWSMPIKTDDGKVLGTLGTYFRSRRLPTQAEQHRIAQLAQAAAMVLDV